MEHLNRMENPRKTTDTQFFRENLWKNQGNQRKLIQKGQFESSCLAE